MTLSKEKIEKLNASIEKAQKKTDKKREALQQFCQEMTDRRKEMRENHNACIDMLYRHRVEDLRESIHRKRRFLKNDVYIGYISGGNILDDTPLVFFGEMFRSDHKREWDHNPSDEELYEFVCDIYGKPKYKECVEVKYTVPEFKGMWINGVYWKKDENSDLVKTEELYGHIL